MPQRQITFPVYGTGIVITSGQTPPQGCDGFDMLALSLQVGLSAGQVVLTIQVSADGASFGPHPDATATATLTANGNVLLIARAPIGPYYRLDYQLTTGPLLVTVYPMLSVGGL